MLLRARPSCFDGKSTELRLRENEMLKSQRLPKGGVVVGAVAAALCVTPNANAQLLGNYSNTCTDTLTCSDGCSQPDQFVVTGYCLIPGKGENGSGSPQNMGVINGQWVCTYATGSSVKAIEVWAGCLSKTSAAPATSPAK
jgi:hypothetical protein